MLCDWSADYFHVISFVFLISIIPSRMFLSDQAYKRLSIPINSLRYPISKMSLLSTEC